MMHHKALLFRDASAAQAILASQRPSEQKALGKKIKKWGDKERDRVKFEVAVEGTRLKFRNG